MMTSHNVPKPVTIRYGDHVLQTICVWPLDLGPATESLKVKYWVIYIHGGAWRDPAISSLSLLPTLDRLLSPPHAPLTTASVAAFASLNYRLSPHPSHPQDSDMPASALHNAKHPDHICDVRAGIKALQDRYDFGGRYVLIGHSCGATLALQCVMGPNVYARGDEGVEKWEAEDEFESPASIVAVSGIYDLRLLVENHADTAAYREFVVGAFGKDEKLWDEVSPAKFWRFGKTWERGRLVVLAHSMKDELIEDAQIMVMEKTLSQYDAGIKVVVLNDLSGGHDELWEKGTELANVVVGALRELVAAE